MPTDLDGPPGLPGPDGNQLSGATPVTNKSRAEEVRDFHWRGLRARKHRDLTAEKYLLHVDGEGGAQWYDLYHGQRLKIPANLSGTPRIQNNQLRPIVDNFVAHLTTQQYRVVVNPPADRESRQSAMIDQALINHLIRSQRWNALFAEAKYMAACTGFCPIHSMWRTDMNSDPYEALLAKDEQGNPMMGPRPGMIDSWVGNPFDTVFNSGARRNSIHRVTYGRVLPTEMVNAAFGTNITGNDRQPSASTFQRAAQKWTQAAGMIHGSSLMTLGWGHDELSGLIYEELLPGIDPQWPQGRLSIIALEGLSGTSRDEARGGVGTPVLLHEGVLPAGVFSHVNIYSHHRHDDPMGKPFVADLDDDQIQLNQLESLVNEYLRRASRPPLASSGKVNVDSINYRGDTVLEVEPLVGSSVELSYLEYPGRHVVLLGQKIERVLESMYRKGGWQAASRGEMKGSGKAIIALQQADDSIFGPMIQRTREEIEAFARLNWKLCKTYMDIPMIIDVAGDEYAHIVEPYLERNALSDRTPSFIAVNGFGTSTEARAQQLLNMFGMVDQNGEQVLGTRELRKQWPDPSMFQYDDDPAEVRRRRPRIVNETIRKATKQFRQQFPELPFSMSDPQIIQAAQYIAVSVDMAHPALMDDNLQHHIDVLSVITQDETEDPLARRVAIVRQQQFWMWLAKKMEAQTQAAEKAAEAGVKPKEGEEKRQKSPVRKAPATPSTAQAIGPGREGQTVTAGSMVQADKQFAKQVS